MRRGWSRDSGQRDEAVRGRRDQAEDRSLYNYCGVRGLNCNRTGESCQSVDASFQFTTPGLTSVALRPLLALRTPLGESRRTELTNWQLRYWQLSPVLLHFLTARAHSHINRYFGPLPPSLGVHLGPMTSVALQSTQFAGLTTSRSPSRS